MKKQILSEQFIRIQRLAGIITESQYEDLTLEPEDMDNPDEDLVIIGSGYLDIKNKFRERPSQTNSEYAELGQKVVDQLHNGDIEAALDYIYSKINESNTNEMEQLTKQKNKTMTLKELQKMIKEEFNAYMGEAEDDVEVSVSDNDVDAEMGDEMAPAGDEDVLRKIYDLLDAHFNGGEEAEEAPEEEAPADDVEGEEEESDLDENSTTDAKFQKTGMAPMSKGSAGANVGYGKVGGKGSTGYDASSKALQERFQKLANIIK